MNQICETLNNVLIVFTYQERMFKRGPLFQTISYVYTGDMTMLIVLLALTSAVEVGSRHPHRPGVAQVLVLVPVVILVLLTVLAQLLVPPVSFPCTKFHS